MSASSPDPVALLARLIAIDSVNPDLVAGGAGETAIADFCGTWLTARGFDVHRLENRRGRPSTVALVRGRAAGRQRRRRPARCPGQPLEVHCGFPVSDGAAAALFAQRIQAPSGTSTR